MKKLILITAVFSITISVGSQNVFLPSQDALLDGYSLSIKPPVTSSSWARGIFYYNTANIRLGGFGLLGNGTTTINQLYMAHGDSPWNSGLGLYIKPDGNTGIGTTTPSEKLHVDGNLLLNAYESNNDERGIFFRNAFNQESNKYNLSLLTYDHSNNGSTPDGLSINAYDGVSFSTGSSTRNERMRIATNGNVGIGTTTPNTKLELLSGENNGSNPPVFRLTSNDVDAVNNQLLGDIQFYNGDLDGKHISSYIRSLAAELYGRKGQLAFGTAGTNSTDAIERMRIDENGNVGIGTTEPTTKLDVKGISKATNFEAETDIAGNILDLKGNQNSRIKAYIDAIDYSWFGMDDHAGKNRFEIRVKSGEDSWLRLKNKNGSEAFSFAEGGEFGNFMHMPKAQSRIVIGGWGNYLFDEGHKLVVKDGSAKIEGNIITNNKIGVGVESVNIPADYKLAVAGGIISEEVKVKLQTSWPDYVFNDSYNLPSLKDVENQIKTKGHLANIPNANEVLENGILLGEMNAKLLQKIEELTLYTIEQEKKIEAQNKKNKSLESRLEKIEAFIEKTKN